MAVTKVIFADVSTLHVGSTLIEGAQSFQLSRNADVRPINAFNSPVPVLIISTRGPGTGSFSYVASDGSGSASNTDWSGVITGTSITCSGSSMPTGTSQAITASGCVFGGQSSSMNAKSEMMCSVNFTFTSGTW